MLSERTGKIGHLEAMRGIAAFVVVLNHFYLAFNGSDFWLSSPLFMFVNGGGAVMFFFVLSGYVLTVSALTKNKQLIIVRGAIKRWPRLAGPVLLSVLISWSLWQAGLFWHSQGARITGSQWLANFGGSFRPDATPNMGLLAAIEQGTWRTFFLGDSYFDSSLWTMKFELFGSAVVFLVAWVLIATRWLSAQLIVLVAVAALLGWRNPIYLTFWAGLCIAWLQTIFKIEIPRFLATPLIVVAFYLFGFRPNVSGVKPLMDFYNWLPIQDPTYVYGIASVMMLTCVTFCSQISRHLDGKFGVLLGRYSFPMYLIHILVIMSLGMVCLVYVDPLLGFALATTVAIAVSLLGIMVLATALMLIEEKWILIVSKIPDPMLSLLLRRFSSDRTPAALKIDNTSVT